MERRPFASLHRHAEAVAAADAARALCPELTSDSRAAGDTDTPNRVTRPGAAGGIRATYARNGITTGPTTAAGEGIEAPGRT
jgi:hypothetical protein